MLADLLDSLKALEAGGLSWEVLVIDNGSTDDTARVVEDKKRDFPVELRYLYEPRPGLHICRNRGAQEANGTVVAFLDDDMVLDEQWLRGAGPVLEGQASLVGGRILPRWEAPPPAWINAFYARSSEGTTLGYLGIIDLGNSVKNVHPYHVFGGNCFVKRDVLFELKGYHPDSLPQELIKFRGDGETGFSLKFINSGMVSLYAPVALAYHRISADRLTVAYLRRRAYNQGISDSFTGIRKERGLYPEKPAQPEESGKMPRLARNFAATAVVRLRGIYHTLLLLTSRVERIKWQVNKSYLEGFAFHRKTVVNDPSLMDWVLRKDYWGENGVLPV